MGREIHFELDRGEEVNALLAFEEPASECRPYSLPWQLGALVQVMPIYSDATLWAVVLTYCCYDYWAVSFQYLVIVRRRNP